MPSPPPVVANDQRLTTNDAPYQDDLETPGISPRSASPLKHKRHSPNLRRKARGRPQILQRLCLRVENFGFFTFCGLVLLSVPSFTRFAVVAKFAPNSYFDPSYPDRSCFVSGHRFSDSAASENHAPLGVATVP